MFLWQHRGMMGVRIELVCLCCMDMNMCVYVYIIRLCVSCEYICVIVGERGSGVFLWHRYGITGVLTEYVCLCCMSMNVCV